MKQLLIFGALAIVMSIEATVPQLEELLPSARGYELIRHCRPMRFSRDGYLTDRSRELEGTLQRLGYLLKLTALDGTMRWVFVEMDPFTQNLACVGVPDGPESFAQTCVTNMTVSGNHPKLKTGHFEKGNIEFWCGNYKCENSMKIPGASDRSYDFGDSADPAATAGYGSMQVHNHLHKQTVFAFNHFQGGDQCDLGIGSNLPPAPGKGFADWTFSKSAKSLKDAELFIVGKFENLRIRRSPVPDFSNVEVRGESTKAFFAPGEEIAFTLRILGLPENARRTPFRLQWIRKGDDGKTIAGSERIFPDASAVLRTKLECPGFVWLHVVLADEKGTVLRRKNGEQITFDGGAGVEIEKLKSLPEPPDFDSFWQRQKQRLAEVPMGLPEIRKISKAGAKTDVFAIRIPCAGPQPVSGYLRMPAHAAPKSLKATVCYHGYGTRPQTPDFRTIDRIEFSVNAHGYELGRDKAYYRLFFESIRSNGKNYAFDPQQNGDPEKSYFNGMALRVMRSLEFVRTLPQWNGRDLTVSGGSQGGMQAIWAAALDHTVTECHSDVTWCCDFAGPVKLGRVDGWRPAYVPALEYYDPVHLARRIPASCRVVIGRAGLGDYTCPPSGITVMYNNLTAPKRIHYYQGSTHAFVPKNPRIFTLESDPVRSAAK